MQSIRPLISRTLTLVIVLAVSRIAQAQFVFDITQGGWVDEQAGLVWGYNIQCYWGSTNFNFGGAELFAENNYVQSLEDASLSFADRGDAALADAIAAEDAGDSEGAAYYYELADFYYFRADALFDAFAAIAPENLDGWRLPTIDEMEAAASIGLFDVDRDPVRDPDNPCVAHFGHVRFSSSLRGKNYVYVFQPSTGKTGVQDIQNGCCGMPIVVRSLNGDTGGGGGGGNGHGNGGKK